jgi:hypothetical protein
MNPLRVSTKPGKDNTMARKLISARPAIKSVVTYVTIRGEKIPFDLVARLYVDSKDQKKTLESNLGEWRDAILSGMCGGQSIAGKDYIALKKTRDNTRYVGIPSEVQDQVDSLLAPYRTIVKCDVLEVSPR